MLLTCILFRPVTEVQVKNPSKNVAEFEWLVCGLADFTSHETWRHSRPIGKRATNRIEVEWHSLKRQTDPAERSPGHLAATSLKRKNFGGKKRTLWPTLFLLSVSCTSPRSWIDAGEFYLHIDTHWTLVGGHFVSGRRFDCFKSSDR